ncbi:MAG: hypothetical protein ACREO3_05960 [Arenimonas sp.]
MQRLSAWRIAATSVVLAALAAWAISRRAPDAPPLAGVAGLPRPTPAVDDFDVAAYAPRNDVPVLRAALSGFCDGDPGSSLLMVEPIDYFDWRTDLHPVLPTLPDCPGIEFVRSGQIDAAYARAKPHPLARAASGTTAGWAELLRDFPRAELFVSVSLPIYAEDGKTAMVQLVKGGPCEYCSSGWEYDLVLREGRWTVVGQRNTMIS